ncbi:MULTISPECIES: hypothetical protein [Paracoccaceae]|jgi:ABC-type transporter Mla subunit MlaD|uniref:hypothetical protein n=1 Tax=Rhodobacterales TaxID=204455 RepID=UPI001B29409D|nr:hypothetical protein [Boseongicola sp. H5]MBO6604899.1 hypothetical protein [Roseicyclus sp.]MBO6625719.1 hypothetical protein [Roseicyclus sp.]MBO6922445.1 hypothetical protein [Roseicyclus sp.]
MSDQSNSNSNSGNGALAFILGGVVVALGVVAWVVFGGGIGDDTPDVRIEVPGVGAVEGTVEEG